MNSLTSRILSVLLIFCIGTCLFTICYHMFNQKYETETAIISSADESASFKGVYIRNEEIVEYGGTGTVSYCVSDGGKLGKGSAIAEIYADERQIDIKQQISDLNAELSILEKIQNPGTLESAQPANIAGLIDEQYKNIINSRESRNLDELASQKNEFLIVSYADGYEDELTKDNLSRLTPELINEVKDSGPIDDKKVIGKLINGYEWYVAGVIDNRKKNFSIDDMVKLKFQSTSDTADGIIYDIRETKNSSESIIIIRCDELTYDLVQHRTERVDMISGEYEGIKVPRKAIRFQDGKGVYVKLGERISFKKIDVIYEGGDYVLSSLNAGDGYLSLYDDIVVEGVDANGN